MAAISTHTPLAGRNRSLMSRFCRSQTFLLTRPSRGATSWNRPLLECFSISTHTPLAGRNTISIYAIVPFRQFLLTRPSRGATFFDLLFMRLTGISTHTPLAGRNLYKPDTTLQSLHFYSHAPRGAQQIVHWIVIPSN